MKLLVIDGNSIVNRAFFGIKLLTTKDGKFTNAIYGFLNIFLKLQEDLKPDAVAFAFDLKSPTFRHKLYDGYKAGRKSMPPELSQQMPVLKELLQALGYKTLSVEGFEADDILGTLAKAGKSDDICYIATGDRDSLQLVDDKITVCLASTKETILYTPERVKEDYSLTPELLKDLKALQGDSSDKIPGVPGVGPKIATDLILKFGTLNEIYEKLEKIDIKENLRKKLKENEELARLSYTLGVIDTAVPVNTDYSEYIKSGADNERAAAILRSLEMYKFIERLGLSNAANVETFKELDKPLEVKENFKETAKTINELYLNCVFKDGELKKAFAVVGNVISKINCDSKEEMNLLKNLLENNDIPKYLSDSKELFKYAEKNGFEILNVRFDILLAAYLINPNGKNYTLERLAEEYEITASSERECLFTEALKPLCEVFYKILDSRNQLELLKNIEIPLARVLSSMELAGVGINVEGIKEFSEMLSEKISECQKKIYELSREEFNINSPKQLGNILYDKLGIEKKGKKASTAADVLESLKDEYEIVQYILDYRSYTKLKSTYCDGLLSCVCSDGRIHTTFNQTETRTGRISSLEPNLQNIPVRTALGAEMRKFFVAAEKSILIDADYSQIELRVLADLSDDENMQYAFNENVDIHTHTASQVFNLPENMITPEMRRNAKAVNFGIVYGIGAFSLGKDIGVPTRVAGKYINDYLHNFSGVESFMKRTIENAKRDGYVKTMFQRRRYLPELSSSNAMIRGFGERVARNMPIQGTAADIIKIAMIRVYDRLRREGLKTKLILQVHDELILEAPIDEKEQAEKIVKEEMESAVKLKVELVSDEGTGKTWYDAKS
ncbi:MAG: DNA polymerase I [Candidatus Fimenecus sp.]